MTRNLWLALAVSCGLDSWPGDDSGSEWEEKDRGSADADADTDTDSDVDITYPTDEMNSILLYNGHGGPDGLDDYGWGVFQAIIKSHWRDYHNWNVHWRAALPATDGFDYYRLVGLISPGATSDEPFEEADRIKIRRSLKAGTRVVLFADRGGCDNPHLDTLLEDLGVTMRLTGEGAGLRLIVDEAVVKKGHQITKGVESVYLEDPCYISKGSGTALITWDVGDERHVLAAVERPGTGGDVVIIGDFQILDDSGNFYEADNHVLVDNLATIVP